MHGDPKRYNAWRPRLIGISALLMTSIMWGSSFPAIKFTVSIIDEATYTWMRGAISLLGLFPYFVHQLSKNKIKKREILGGLAAGVSFILGIWLQGWGTKFTTASNSAFITGLFIVFVHIYDASVNKNYSPRTVASLIAAVAGIYFLTKPSGGVGIGEMLVLIGAVFWAAQVLIVDKFSDTNPIIFTFYEVIPSVFFIPISLMNKNFSISNTLNVLPAIIYLGLVSTNIAFILQVYGQRWLGPFESSLIMLFEPIFAAIFAAILLGERFTLTWLLGSMLILIGMFVAISRAKLKINKSSN